jgi:pyruvate kinase
MHSALESRRRTRIVATIGPASDADDVLRSLAKAGMDVARVPFAHGTLEEAMRRMAHIRRVVPDVAILADLPGPKIRTTPFSANGSRFESGDRVLLTTEVGAPNSTRSEVGIVLDGADLILQPGQVIYLGDGGISFEVVDHAASSVQALVRDGGVVRGRPGVTLPSTMSFVTPTPTDLRAAEALRDTDVDLVAVSFVRSADDLLAMRSALAPLDALLVAKIETTEAMDNLSSILEVSDAVMVARGDLGVRVPLEYVPRYQKEIIREGVRFARPVITATQMLESMTGSLSPTRAEVTDVANAVLDGTSAVMLSGETAIGAHPVETVATIARIASYTESYFDFRAWGATLDPQQVIGSTTSAARIAAAMTGAAWRAALEEQVAAILVWTESGATARALSRFRPPMPIIAATSRPSTARQLAVSWGVISLLLPEVRSFDEAIRIGTEAAVVAGYVRRGELLAVLLGPRGEGTSTDSLRLLVA